MTFREVFDLFIADRRMRFVQESSIKTYKANLKAFLLYIGLDTHISELRYDTVMEFISSLNGMVKRNTAVSYIRDIKILLTFADGHERLRFNPKRIKRPRSEKKDIVIYTPSQWDMILAACETYIDWLTLRNIAILTCIYDSGIRRKEACSIKVSSFQKVGDKVFCTVYGKGMKERQVLFGKTTLKAFEGYVEACPFKIEDDFFLTKTGAPIVEGTISQFAYDVQKRLPFRFSVHMLRHNYATRVCQSYILRHGHADVDRLSIYLGHESTKTTERYIHCANKLIARDRALSLFDENLICLGMEGIA